MSQNADAILHVVLVFLALVLIVFAFQTGRVVGMNQTIEVCLQSCSDTIEYLGGMYKEILFKFADIDVEKVLKSYEYCELVMNQTNQTMNEIR